MKNLSPTPLLIVLLSIVAFGWSSAEAASRGGATTMDVQLSAGGGIVSPGALGAMVSNPAGLVYNNRFKIGAHVDVFDQAASMIGAGGRGYFGTGNFAGAVGGHYLNTTRGIGLDVGGAFYIDKIKTALGVSWAFALSNGGAAGSIASSDGNAGLLINPMGRFRVGVSGLALLNAAARTVGAGVEFQAHRNFSILVDGLYAIQAQIINIDPAIKVHFQPVQFMVGYALNPSAIAWNTSAFRAGLGVDISSRAQLHFYYNQFGVYHGALAIQL